MAHTDWEERTDVIVTNQNGPGLWYFARYAILERYGLLEAEDGRHQRELVVWLRDEYPDMIQDPNACITDLCFKLNSKISIPSKIEAVQIIGGYSSSGMTHSGEICIKPYFSSIEVIQKDAGNNETVIGNTWAIGKELQVVVKCKEASDRTQVTIDVYQEKDEHGYSEPTTIAIKNKTIETGGGESTYIAEWAYKYNNEALSRKPLIYFRASITNSTEEIYSQVIEMAMDIDIVVIDHDDVVVIDAGKENTTDPAEKSNMPIRIQFKAEQEGILKRELWGKPDSNGEYHRGGLIPCGFSVSVRTPIKRKYTTNKYTTNTTNEKLHDYLEQIDGSERIKHDSSGKFEIGKTNVIKLPVRYLNQEETKLVRKILGDRYSHSPIEIGAIQIFKYDTSKGITGNVTVKQLREVLDHFEIDEPECFQNINDDAIIQEDFNTIGLSLPNGIIYIPVYSRSTTKEFDALMVHEAFHQYQYQRDGKKAMLEKLIDEMNEAKLSSGTFDPYDFNNHAGPGFTQTVDILSLEQIETLEGRAQFIEDFALAHLEHKPAIYILANYKPAMENTADSGIKTNVQF